MLWALVVRAAAPDPDEITRPDENIAAGKPYRLSPAPDCVKCQDGHEDTKLTDGVYSKPYLWTQKTTVGWENEASPIIITVDLGQIEPICGVSLNTAAGLGRSHWPVAIDILISDDGQQYRYAGELMDMDYARRAAPVPDSLEYAAHRYWVDTLRVQGRYVALVISRSGATFVDEVEVYRGAASEPAPASPPTYSGPERFLQQTATQRGIQRRIRRDALALLYAQLPSMVKLDGQQLTEPLQRIYANASDPAAAARDPGPGFRAILPLTAEHRELFQIAAAQMRAAGQRQPAVYAADLWGPLPHLGVPADPPAPRVRIDAMQGEYRAAAINIVNPLDHELRLRLRLAGLPGGTTPPYVAVRQVLFTDTRTSEVVAAALIDAERDQDRWMITVPSGMTRQVWLTFHTAGVPNGDHNGHLVLEGDGIRLDADVQLRIAPLDFPKQPTLRLGGWDELDMPGVLGTTQANRDAMAATLRDYQVDTPWATAHAWMPGLHDRVLGHMVQPPDTRRFDEWVRLWSGARRYGIYVAASNVFSGFAIDRPQFTTAVQAWVGFWAAHAAKMGVPASSIYLYLVDEPHTPAEDRVVIAWARAIRSSGTGVKVWANPRHSDPARVDPDFYALVDVLCPNRQTLYASGAEAYRMFYESQRPSQASLELYSAAGPARLMDLYGYYRLSAWDCWRLGAEAGYFWSFADNGGASSWNEYAAPRVPYTPLFLDANEVRTSKQMEAIREGREDYEYLAILRSRLQELEAQGEVPPKALEAKDLLRNAPARVLPVPGKMDLFWRDQRDRSVADKVRREILDMLITLQ